MDTDVGVWRSQDRVVALLGTPGLFFFRISWRRLFNGVTVGPTEFNILIYMSITFSFMHYSLSPMTNVLVRTSPADASFCIPWSLFSTKTPNFESQAHLLTAPFLTSAEDDIC